jgi:RsiW-degrading membrane proteinase PrsW (M82 family)
MFFLFPALPMLPFLLIHIVAAVLPAFLLLRYIYRHDTVEKEPPRLLGLLLLMGVLSALIAGVLESIGLIPLNMAVSSDSTVYTVLLAFLVVAVAEEGAKYLLLRRTTWKHPAFNYRFDGVVYSTAVAIGFEVIENLLYLVDSTAGTAFTRAAFPGHCIFGIYMGYYYGQAKTLELNGDKKGASAMRKKGVITAILIHGFYDFVCFIGGIPESDIAQVLIMLGLVLLMVVLNVTAYKNIKKFAYEDKPV